MKSALLLLALASGGALAQTAPTTAAPQDGQKLFRAQCGGCHLERGFGTRVLARRMPADQAVLEARTDLMADYVRIVVRHGVGSMPTFRKTELTDKQLDAIATYLAKGEGK